MTINKKLIEERDSMNSAVFMYFVFPFLLGIMIRLLFFKWKKGYILSGAFALIAVAVWIWTNHLVNHGVDGTLLLWAVMAAELAVGSLIADGILLLMRKK